MVRHVLAAMVVMTDTVLMALGRQDGFTLWAVASYGLAAAGVIALLHRVPVAAFVAAIALASLVGAAYVLLLWVAYHTGRAIMSRSAVVVVIGATIGGLSAQLLIQAGELRAIPNLLSSYVIFVALPLLTGRYLAQHQRMLSTLDQHNRQLRWQRDILAEQERLRERLRIARDMHDSLGHRLSLVSVQAAALEVSTVPEPQKQAIRQLADTTRNALDELYELVGALRGAPATAGRDPGIEAIGALVKNFHAAGVLVALQERGRPRVLTAAAGQAVYRVVEEGLTNAAKHAPGQPITVSLDWELDALLLTIVNPLPDDTADPSGATGGHGLAGLRERIDPLGGVLDHGRSGRTFRLFAMLPAMAEAPSQPSDSPPIGSVRTVALGFAIAALTFVILPLAMLVGVR